MKLDALQSIPSQHAVMSHPFIQAFSQGLLTSNQVKFWAKQQFYFSISLPSAFAALYAKIPDHFWKEKRALIELIKVEAWGSPSESSHSKHFIELCEFLGLNVLQLTQESPKSYTQEYLGYRLHTCLDSNIPVTDGLACLAVANELLNLFLFGAYRKGIRSIPGFEACPTGYFDAHLADEQKDAKIFLHLFDFLTDSQIQIDSAQHTIIQMLDRRVVFFDQLYQDVLDQ